MKLRSLLFFITLISNFCWAQEQANQELEEILRTEIAELIFDPLSPMEGGEMKNNSEMLSKLDSLNEIYDDYLKCAQLEVHVNRSDFGMFTVFAFSCNLTSFEILSSEIVFKNEKDGFGLHNYESMILGKQEMTPKMFESIFLDDKLSVVQSMNKISPGIRSLINIAKVGAPVYLSLKTAKIICPFRTDWQKHIMAGSIISGVTVLTSQAIIRTYNNRNGSKLSDNQINVLASFSGLLGSFAAGVAKEARDKWTGKGTPDKMDVLYTGLGGAMVSVTVAIPIPTKQPRTYKKRL
jgi:hypothetical protein